MILLPDRTASGTVIASEKFLAVPRRADTATVVSVFIVLQLLIPTRLVISGIPLSLSPAAIVCLFLGLWWICAQFTSTLGLAKGRNAVRTMLFLYACSILATYGYSTFGYLPSDELQLSDHYMVLAFGGIGLALAVCDGIRDRDRLDFMLKTLVVVGAMVAVIGILQFIANFDLTRYISSLPGLRYSGDDIVITERSTLRRVPATTGHPIEFGVMSAMLLPLAVHYAMAASRRAQPVFRWWLCAGLIACGLMFSISRSAILGMAGAGIVLFIGWPGRRRLQALGAIAGFLAVMKVVVPGLLGTFYSLFANLGSDSSIQYRTHDYTTARIEISKHFWLGRGLGTWYAPKHEVFDNQYLLSLVEIGALGMIAFIGIFLAGLYTAARSRLRSVDTVDRDLALTLAAMIVVPIVGCATFDLAAFSTASALALLTAGAAGALWRITQASHPRSPAHLRAKSLPIG